MTSVLYFLHLKTLDILLLIVNISVADDAFYKSNVFIVVVKMTERRKNQSEEWTLLFMYFITVNKYRFCISVIGYINVQIIVSVLKKSISVDH